MDKDTAFADLIKTTTLLSESECALFWSSLLTESEKTDIALRWAILNDLQNVVPQRKIAENYDCSLKKVSRCSSILKNKSDVIARLLQHRYDETSIE